MTLTKRIFCFIAIALSGSWAAEGTHRVTIDASALSTPRLSVRGIGEFPTAYRESFDLQPGTYTVSYTLKHGIGGNFPDARIVFEVTDEGMVDFPPAYDQVLLGRGDSLLVIRGVAIDLDLTALGGTTAYVEDSQGGRLSTNTYHVLQLLPGAHRLTNGDAEWVFNVTLGAKIDYDSSLDDALLGKGTAMLVVFGMPAQPIDLVWRIANLCRATERAYPNAHAPRALAEELLSLSPHDYLDLSMTTLHAYIGLMESTIAEKGQDSVGGRLLMERAHIIKDQLQNARETRRP